MSRITFLHTADVHLGAPMRGLRDVSGEWAARLQEAHARAFDSVIELAVSREVDFMVLAGDAFDTAQTSYADYLRFFEGLHRLHEAGTPLYLVPGNHDPYSAWQKDAYRLPPSAHLLGGGANPDFALYERDGKPLCLVGARGYRSPAWPIDESMAQGITRAAAISALGGPLSPAARAPFCIGVVHAALAPDQSKAYCDIGALLAADIDYWACGHLHEKLVRPNDRNPKVVFPGCTQGRGIDEEGGRGCYLVTMEKAGAAPVRTEIEFAPTADVVFHTVKVDVGACQTLADIAHHVQAQLFHVNAKAACERMVVRIVLSGTTELHEFLTQEAVRRDLRKRVNNAYPLFFCDALVNATRPPRSRATMLREGLFEAHVLRVADGQRANPQETVNFVQAEFVKRDIAVPSSLSQRAGGFNDEAETLVLDLLAEDGA